MVLYCWHQTQLFMEEWRQVVDFDKYEVSSLGRIRRISTGQILKQTTNDGGYKKVNLSRPDLLRVHRSGRRDSSRVVLVHRAVARAFLGEPVGDRVLVDHKDRVRDHNELANLRWASRRENLENTDWGVPRICRHCDREL